MKDYRWGTMIPLIGGSAIGCSMATGNKPLFHLSFDGFQYNDNGILNYWPGIPYYLLDKDTIDTNENHFKSIDFVNSVCPCAALARLNTSTGDKTGAYAPQNEWMYKSAEFVLGSIQPTVYFGENAPALCRDAGKPVVKRLVEIGKKYGYCFAIYRTDTKFHGLPQRRSRCFYYFFKGEEAPLMDYFRKPWATGVADFLKQIPADATCQGIFHDSRKCTDTCKEYAFLLDKSGMTHEQFVEANNGKSTTAMLQKSPALLEECMQWVSSNCPDSVHAPSGRGKTTIEKLEYMKSKFDNGKGVFDSGIAFHSDMMNAIISKNIATMCHPTENRFLNYREMLTLMGMPYDFEPVSIKEKEDYVRAYIIGQNVPSTTAKDACQQALDFIDGKSNGTVKVPDGEYLLVDNIRLKTYMVAA